MTNSGSELEEGEINEGDEEILRDSEAVFETLRSLDHPYNGDLQTPRRRRPLESNHSNSRKYRSGHHSAALRHRRTQRFRRSPRRNTDTTAARNNKESSSSYSHRDVERKTYGTSANKSNRRSTSVPDSPKHDSSREKHEVKQERLRNSISTVRRESSTDVAGNSRRKDHTADCDNSRHPHAKRKHSREKSSPVKSKDSFTKYSLAHKNNNNKRSKSLENSFENENTNSNKRQSSTRDIKCFASSHKEATTTLKPATIKRGSPELIIINSSDDDEDDGDDEELELRRLALEGLFINLNHKDITKKDMINVENEEDEAQQLRAELLQDMARKSRAPISYDNTNGSPLANTSFENVPVTPTLHHSPEVTFDAGLSVPQNCHVIPPRPPRSSSASQLHTSRTSTHVPTTSHIDCPPSNAKSNRSVQISDENITIVVSSKISGVIPYLNAPLTTTMAKSSTEPMTTNSHSSNSSLSWPKKGKKKPKSIKPVVTFLKDSVLGSPPKQLYNRSNLQSQSRTESTRFNKRLSNRERRNSLPYAEGRSFTEMPKPLENCFARLGAVVESPPEHASTNYGFGTTRIVNEIPGTSLNPQRITGSSSYKERGPESSMMPDSDFNRVVSPSGSYTCTANQSTPTFYQHDELPAATTSSTAYNYRREEHSDRGRGYDSNVAYPLPKSSRPSPLLDIVRDLNTPNYYTGPTQTQTPNHGGLLPYPDDVFLDRGRQSSSASLVSMHGNDCSNNFESLPGSPYASPPELPTREMSFASPSTLPDLRSNLNAIHAYNACTRNVRGNFTEGHRLFVGNQNATKLPSSSKIPEVVVSDPQKNYQVLRPANVVGRVVIPTGSPTILNKAVASSPLEKPPKPPVTLPKIATGIQNLQVSPTAPALPPVVDSRPKVPSFPSVNNVIRQSKPPYERQPPRKATHMSKFNLRNGHFVKPMSPIVIPVGNESSSEEDTDDSSKAQSSKKAKSPLKTSASSENSSPSLRRNQSTLNETQDLNKVSSPVASKSPSLTLPANFESALAAMLRIAREKASKAQQKSTPQTADEIIASLETMSEMQRENLVGAATTTESSESAEEDMARKKEELELREKLLKATLMKKVKNSQAKLQLVAAEKKLIRTRTSTTEMFDKLYASMMNFKEKRTLFNDTFKKILMLRKQLQAAEKRLQIARSSVTLLSGNVRESSIASFNVRQTCIKLMKKCTELGKQVSGPNYKLPTQGAPELNKVFAKVREQTLLMKQINDKNKIAESTGSSTSTTALLLPSFSSLAASAAAARLKKSAVVNLGKRNSCSSTEPPVNTSYTIDVTPLLDPAGESELLHPIFRFKDVLGSDDDQHGKFSFSMMGAYEDYDHPLSCIKGKKN